MRLGLSKHKLDVKESSMPDAENDGPEEEALEELEMLLKKVQGHVLEAIKQLELWVGDVIGVG